MGIQIAFLQTFQILLLIVVVPVIVFYVMRTIIKLKVHRAVYGNDISRYVEDKILEKKAKLNREQDGK